MKEKHIYSADEVLRHLRLLKSKLPLKKALKLTQQEWKSDQSRLSKSKSTGSGTNINTNTVSTARTAERGQGRGVGNVGKTGKTNNHRDGDGMVFLFREIHRLRELQEVFFDVLSEDFGEECSLAEYKDGKMVILCKDANLASYVRYHAEEYIQKLRCQPEFSDLKSVQVGIKRM